MPRAKKPVGKDDFVFIRPLMGKGPNAHRNYHYIPDGGMNKVIQDWHSKQPEREITNATPSGLLTCPRVIWLKYNGVPITKEMTWAVKQRLLLGRMLEDLFASQLNDEGLLLYHWKDNPDDEVERFKMGKGDTYVDGVPDYVLDLNGVVAVSDAKTARSDSFGYVGISEEELFGEWGYYKYRIQLTAYYLLCHKNKQWFEEKGLPLPTHCHLFTYALDDGVIRREQLWQPTQEDMQTCVTMAKRYNQAIASPTMPACTCKDSINGDEVKFCDYGQVEQGKKIAETCCDDSLGEQVRSKK